MICNATSAFPGSMASKSRVGASALLMTITGSDQMVPGALPQFQLPLFTRSHFLNFLHSLSPEKCGMLLSDHLNLPVLSESTWLWPSRQDPRLMLSPRHAVNTFLTLRCPFVPPAVCRSRTQIYVESINQLFLRPQVVRLRRVPWRTREAPTHKVRRNGMQFQIPVQNQT
jgi:hypothetical protein